MCQNEIGINWTKATACCSELENCHICLYFDTYRDTIEHAHARWAWQKSFIISRPCCFDEISDLEIWAETWDFQQCGMCDQQILRSACACAQSDLSLCLSLDYFLIVKLLTEQHLKFLSLTGGCTGSFESTFVKIPHCWKSHVAAH